MPLPVGGGVLGNVLGGGTLGTLLGAGGGALLGQNIDRKQPTTEQLPLPLINSRALG